MYSSYVRHTVYVNYYGSLLFLFLPFITLISILFERWARHLCTICGLIIVVFLLIMCQVVVYFHYFLIHSAFPFSIHSFSPKILRGNASRFFLAYVQCFKWICTFLSSHFATSASVWVYSANHSCHYCRSLSVREPPFFAQCPQLILLPGI